MISTTKKYLWRKNEFVCPADFYKEIFEKTKNLNQIDAVKKIDDLTQSVQITKTVVDSAINKMMRQ